MDEIQTLIKQELEKTLKTMLNEIEISFDYFPKETINYCNSINIETFVNEILELEISVLEKIKLFNGKLDFEIFKNENKNTKKTLLEYIKTLRMHCALLKGQGTPEELLKYIVPPQSTQSTSGTSKKDKKKSKRRQQQGQGLPEGMDWMADLMKNKEIMSLATDIADNMSKESMDPVKILTGLMTGNMDPSLKGLVDKVQTQVTEKIDKGELDTKVFEDKFKDFGNVNNMSDLMSKMNMKI